MTSPQVAIVMGSDRDLEGMREAEKVLRELGIGCEMRILSAHRTPDEATAFARDAHERGIRVIVAGAGAAAHLAGALAARTVLPVIGVPLASTALSGLDALLAMVQMPSGVPVATVAIGGAANAALLAAEMLAISDPALTERLRQRRFELAERVKQSDEALRQR